jgi:hypothetical protein
VVATTFSAPIESLDAAHCVVSDLTGIRVERVGDEIVLHLTPLPIPAAKS